MDLEILTIIGTVLVTVGGIILGKLYTERGSIKLYEALATALEGIKDTQTSIPLPVPEETHDEGYIDDPPLSHPPIDNSDYPFYYSQDLVRVSEGLKQEINTVQSRNKRDLKYGTLFIIIGIILLISPSIITL